MMKLSNILRVAYEMKLLKYNEIRNESDLCILQMHLFLEFKIL